jgi:micrococcal nuclease
LAFARRSFNLNGLILKCDPMEILALLLVVGFVVQALRPRRRFRRSRKKFQVLPPAARGTATHSEVSALEERLSAFKRGNNRVSNEVVVVDVMEVRGPAWVIDGDTIDIQGTRIRLAGIDAPELDHPYGNVAKGALIRLCRGQVVRAVSEGNLSHERAVATCYLPDGRDLSAEMVRAGLALDWRKFSGGKYRHLEPEGIRRKLWRCDARQKGQMPPTLPD